MARVLKWCVKNVSGETLGYVYAHTEHEAFQKAGLKYGRAGITVRLVGG